VHRHHRLLLLALSALGGLAPAPIAAASDPVQGQEWFLSAVGADQVVPPGPGIPLTIVDTGVDAAQPDFAGRPATAYLNAQTSTGEDESHGTEVASVAAAPANGIGIVGIYPRAALDVWDATPAPGAITSAALAAGIAAAPCPGVVNLSIGTTTHDPVVDAAVAAAQRRGCLIVAAAGNLGESGDPVVYPAADLHVLAVGAADQGGAPAPFSSTGPWVDLLAPGVDIAVDTTLAESSTGSAVVSGTSFSSAMVAAAAALIWTERPKLSAAQVFVLLKSTAADGDLDIPAALAAPTPPNDPREPNDTVAEAAAQPPLTTAAHRSNAIAATLDAVKDPRDLYRVYKPPHGRVRLSVTGRAVARLVGSYAEVTLPRGVADASYVMRVTAAPR
jgi:subtilisin family serine protease